MSDPLVSIVAPMLRTDSVQRDGDEVVFDMSTRVRVRIEAEHRHEANNLGRYEQVARDAVENMCRKDAESKESSARHE